jgi:hypothetical protein
VTLPDGYVRDEMANACLLDERFMLPLANYDKLYAHQRDGVKWMWGLHRVGEGGILGDDMVGASLEVFGGMSSPLRCVHVKAS